jgi:hypothetical protein
VPFRGFGDGHWDRRRHRPDPSSRGISYPLRVLRPASTAAIGSAVPLRRRAASLALWFSKNRATTDPLNKPPLTLSEFRLPPEYSLASPSRLCRQGQHCRHLSWALMPFSTSEDRGYTSRGFASPASFRLQGLVTLLAVSSPRTRADLVSCRQRSWALTLRSLPLPKGTPPVSARDEPTCRFTCRYSLGRTLRQARQAPAPGL